MADGFPEIFGRLKAVFSKHTGRLAVKADTPTEYVVTAKSPSPLPQHKGKPLDFGYVRVGKRYVSIHLMPLYMTAARISPELKKRMHGKTCFNFSSGPTEELAAELSRLADEGVKQWRERKWL